MLKTVGGTSSIRKCLAALDCFSESAPCLTLTQVSEKTGFSMPTTLRVLAVLCEEGFLERSKDRLYRPGWKTYRLGRLFDVNYAVHSAVLPAMRRLRDFTGETVSLYCRNGVHRVCVEQAVCPHELRRSSRPDRNYPLWAGASAKVFVCYMTPEEIESVRAEAPPDVLPSWDAFLADARRVRETGYSFSVGEREKGISAIAAPLLNSEGSLVGCLNISGPSFRFTDEIRRTSAAELVRESRELSRTFGPPFPWGGNAPGDAGA